MAGSKQQRDIGELMVSEMAIGREAFGSCAGEINVLIELKNGDDLLCCGRVFAITWRGKAA
jgi:hypothetical protein